MQNCQNCNTFQTGDILEGTPCETCTLLHEDSRPDPDIERTLNWVAKETGETCIWCEHDTAVEVDSESGDPNYDKEAYTNWTKYKCSTCGCEFVLGSKHIDFSDITKAGKLELSVDVPEPHPCEHPTPCKNTEGYANDEYPCNLCERNEIQCYGRDHAQYGDHWEAK